MADKMSDDSLFTSSTRATYGMSSISKYLPSTFRFNNCTSKIAENLNPTIKHSAPISVSPSKRILNLNHYSIPTDSKTQILNIVNNKIKKQRNKKENKNIPINTFEIEINKDETPNEINLNLVNENVKLREENISLLEKLNGQKKNIESELILGFTKEINALKQQIKINENKIKNLKKEYNKSLKENEDLKKIIDDLKKKGWRCLEKFKVIQLEKIELIAQTSNLMRSETIITNNTYYNGSTNIDSYQRNLSYPNENNSSSFINDIPQNQSPLSTYLVTSSDNGQNNNINLYLKKRISNQSFILNNNKEQKLQSFKSMNNINLPFNKNNKFDTLIKFEEEVNKSINYISTGDKDKIIPPKSPKKIIEKKVHLSSKSFYSNITYNNNNKKKTKNDIIPPSGNNAIIETSQVITDSELIFSQKFQNILKEEDISKINYLYHIHPTKKNTMLIFDIKSKMFKCNEFTSKSKDFSLIDNYSKGITSVPIENGAYIIGGERYKNFYFYDNKTQSITQLSSLNFSHCKTVLITISENNTTDMKLISISGTANASVEEYSIRKNKWNELPDLNYSRAEASCLIKNKKDIYIFFGYDYINQQYVESIEWFDMNNHKQWNVIEMNIKIKCHTCFNLCNYEDKMFIFGGRISEEEEKDNYDLIEIRMNENKFCFMKNNLLKSNIKKEKKERSYYFRDYMRDFIDRDTYSWKKCVIDMMGNAHIFDAFILKHEIFDLNE